MGHLQSGQAGVTPATGWFSRRDAAAIGAFLLSGFVLLGPAIGRNALIADNDLLWLFYPFVTFSRDALQQGQLPLWNPHHFLGFPHFAEPQTATFYPIFWLMALTPLPTAQLLTWLFALHLGLGGAGVYVLARQTGTGRHGAALAGLIGGWMAFGPAHVFAGHLPHLWTIAYLPWLLAAAHWSVQRRTLTSAASAGIPLALGIVAGYAPFVPFLVGAVTVWLAWLGGQAWRQDGRRAAARIAAQWVALGATAGALAAVQLWPTLELALRSSRVARADYAFASSLSLPFSYLVTLLLPNGFGSPASAAGYWGSEPIYAYWELILYVGVLPLLLLALIRPKTTPITRFWWLLAVGALLLALGPAAALHRILFDVVPGFGLFRVPGRFGYFVALSLALLAGRSWEAWLKWRTTTFHLRQPVILGVGGAALVLGLLSVVGEFGRIAAVAQQGARTLALAAVTLGLLAMGRTLGARSATALALLIVALDLGLFAQPLWQTLDPDSAPWAVADRLLPPQRTDYRVAADFANNGARFGFYEVNGYDDFRTESSFELAQRMGRDGRIAALLGARYRLQYADRRAPDGALGWSFSAESPPIAVYERQDALPRAFIVHDVIGSADAAQALTRMDDPAWNPATTAIVQVAPDTSCAIEPAAGVSRASVTRYDANHVTIETTSAATGWLVLSDLAYPGWEAAVDGVTVPIQVTNYALRGVCVPGGTHTVTFSYQPRLWRNGGAVTIVACLLVLVALGYEALQIRRP